MAVPPPLPQADRPASSAPYIGKAALRAELRRTRAAFAAAPGAAAAHAALVEHLSPLLAKAGPIAGYVAHRGEPDVRAFLLRAHAQGITVALPHVIDDTRMRFAAWHPDMALTPGLLGIAQPDADADEIVPAIVLTPLVGFDRDGHRLGQGAGYYDRWFATQPDAMRVGIAWSMQEVAALPSDEWDIPLHIIVTEREWISA